MAIVGTAFIRVKLLSNKVGDDIKKAVGDSFKDVGKDVRAASEDLGRDVGDGIGDGIKDSPAVQNAGDTVADNVTRNVNKGFKRTRRQIIGSFKAWLVGGILSAGPGIIAGGLQILSALGASLVALASTLGAAFAGAAIAGFGAFVALKTTMALIKLALDQDTEALKAFNENVKTLKAEIGGAVQVGLLPGLNTAVSNLRKSLPALRKQLTLTGKTVGDLAANFTRALTTAQNLRRINTVLSNNNKFIRLAGQGLTNMAEAALIFLSYLGPITTFIGQLVKDVGAWLLVTTQTAAANGTLATKIQEWFDLARRAFGVLADFGIGLFNIFKGARDSGDVLFTGIETAARNFREWTSSVAGQNSIKKFFEDALPLAQETWGLIGDIFRILAGVSFGDNAGALEFVKTLRESLVPALVDLFDTIRENTGDDWGTAFQNITQAIKDLAESGVLGATAKAISAIALAISGLLKVPFVPEILAWAGSLLLLNKLLFGLPATLLKASGAGKLLSKGFQKLGPILLAAGKSIGGSLLRGIGSALLRLGPLILSALSSAIPAIIGVLASIPVVGWIILAVAAVVAILVVLFLKVKSFRDKVNAVWQSIVDFFKAAWQGISDFFIDIWTSVSETFSEIWNGIREGLQESIAFITGIIRTVARIFSAALRPVIKVVTVVVNIIRKIFEIGFKIIEIIVKVFIAVVILAFKAIAAVVLPIIQRIWQNITTAFNGIRLVVTTVIRAVWTFIVTIFNAIYTFISGVVNRILSVVRTVFNSILNAVKGPLGAVVSFVRSVFGGLASFVSGVWNGIKTAISTAVSGAYDTVVTWFNRIKTFVGNIVGAIKTIASGVWTGIASGLTSILNGVIRGVNTLISGINAAIRIANKLPGVSIGEISPLPTLAEGGVVPATPGGRAAILAEGGRPERVEPLDKDGLSKRDREIIKALSTAGSGGGATTVNVYIGQEKLDAIIDTKIEENNDNLAQQIVTGRR